MLKNKKEIFSWSFYDFANQPFTTIIVTFIYGAFFTSVICSDPNFGTLLWSWGISITAIVVAVLSPILGSFADKSGYRKNFLMIFTWICAISSILLYFPNFGDIYIALILFVIANIAFEIGTVFSNSYLQDLSTDSNIGRISGFAWGLGFLGGLIAMFLSLIFVIQPESPIFGLSRYSSANYIELNIKNVHQDKIYVSSTEEVIEGMYLKLKNNNETEKIKVLSLGKEFIVFSDVVENINFDENKFELYGEPIWSSSESQGNYILIRANNMDLEIRKPIIREDTTVGILSYLETGELLVLDEEFCEDHNLDFEDLHLMSRSTSQFLRSLNIFVGIWFLFFSLPMFLFVKDRKKEKITKKHVLDSFLSIKQTFQEIRSYKIILKFLVARLFFNDALITIFALGGVYAVDTLDFTFNEVMMLGIVLNISAAAGSFIFGYIEDIIGVKRSINISLLVLMFSTILAFIAPYFSMHKEIFWFSGILLGFMVGPNQSCSRSLMSRLTPKEKKNEFFGFFALTGKATSFLGPMLFGIIALYFSQQIALSVVIILFFIGFILFNRIPFKDSI